jgi:beta-mannosidase
VGPNSKVHDEEVRTIGFKRVEWRPCEGAPPAADPWLCVVNDRPIFLQGVNWTPIRPNFADVTEGDYRKRLELYRDLGCNLLRVWGGAFPEKECFYRICDELGLLVWQEFPLSSSGVDNWPPEDEQSIAAMAAIAASYIERRQHHVSLLLWCGGNELVGGLHGSKVGAVVPVDVSHPLIGRLAQVVAERDPGRRFLPTSSSGPRFGARAADFGKGLHWDVHGPWKLPGTMAEWRAYWERDDALFRSETGAPGASPVEIIRRMRGALPETPGTANNPLWRRTGWWIEWPVFVQEHGREPESLEEFVTWSQSRQAEALAIAARACKTRFPRCGGFLVWMGHDSFPCTANTAIVDFDGEPKPAALALQAVFTQPDTER